MAKAFDTKRPLFVQQPLNYTLEKLVHCKYISGIKQFHMISIIRCAFLMVQGCISYYNELIYGPVIGLYR